MDWKKTPVVVTGGAGFIGSHLVDALYHHRGAIPEVFDNLERGRLRNLPDDGYDWSDMDLTDYIPRFPTGAAVFHLAAKVAGIAYNRAHHYEMMQHNLRLALNVIEAARRCKASLLVYVSTACVYPSDARVPTPESAGRMGDPEPSNYGYGVAKWTGEQLAQALHREHGIPVVIPRFYNAIGPRDYYDEESSHVVPALIRRVLEGENPLVVWGSGMQTRSFVDARDLANVLIALAETPAAQDAQPINVGHEHEVTIGDVARAVAYWCGKDDLPILFDTAMADGHARRTPDVTRLRSLLGWVPNTAFAVTICDMITDYWNGQAEA
jgi:GDP-L-fucose synthase